MQEIFTQKLESRFESKQEAAFSSLANMNAMLFFYYTAFALFFDWQLCCLYNLVKYIHT